MKSLVSSSPEETIMIAKSFAQDVKPGNVITLEGNLGAGKTEFVRGFVQGFGLTGEIVNSPTFTIINEYDGEVPIFHFDCFRLEHFKEALEIGAEEYLYGTGVCIVEWPDRISELLPPGVKQITINIKGKNEREIIFH